MKQFIVLLVLLAFNSMAGAQQNLTIRQGSDLKYLITVDGQTFLMYFHVDVFDANNLSVTWSFDNGRTGKFIMGRYSLDSAVSGYWNQPVDGQELKLPGSQNLLFLSKLTYSTLQLNKTGSFDDYSVVVKPPSPQTEFKLNDKLIDALCLENEAGARIWVLNNSNTPLILKTEQNPSGVDVELIEIN